MSTSESNSETSASRAPWWVWPLVAVFGMGCLMVIVLAAAGFYLFRERVVPPDNGPAPIAVTNLSRSFPGGEQERLLWAAMLTQYGDGVERDGTNKLPTLLDRRVLKVRWQEATRYRMDHRGEGRVWGPEYDAVVQEVERRLDRVADEGKLDASERSQIRNTLRGCAEELAGDAWEAAT